MNTTFVKDSIFSFLRRVKILNYLIILVGAFTMIFPFLWMVSTSFKPASEIMSFPPTFFPKTFILSNYVNVNKRLNLTLLYWNTGYVTIVKTIIQVYTSALLGYIFGKFRFWGRDVIFYILLSALILPFEVFMIPLYQMMVKMKLGDNHLALIVPFLFSVYAIFMFRQFMFTIPDDFIDAARVDGAGEWYIFHRIILPLSFPVIATQVTFYFMWNWNDFLWPLIVISSREKAMLPVALATLFGEMGTLDHGLIMAGATLAIIPVLIIFILFQRYIIQGIALTGLK